MQGVHFGKRVFITQHSVGAFALLITRGVSTPMILVMLGVFGGAPAFGQTVCSSVLPCLRSTIPAPEVGRPASQADGRRDRRHY